MGFAGDQPNRDNIDFTPVGSAPSNAVAGSTIYHSTSGLIFYTGTEWVATSGSGGGGSSTLDGLTDTTLSSLTSGDAIRWNGSEWINQQDGTPAVPSVSDLDDTTITSVASGDVLTWNGAGLWVNEAGGGGSLSGLSDTTITAPASGAILSYNGSEWIDTSTPVEVQTSGFIKTLIASGTVTAGTSFDTPTLVGQGYRHVQILINNIDVSAQMHFRATAVNASGTEQTGASDYGYNNVGGNSANGSPYAMGDSTEAFMAITYNLAANAQFGTPTDGKGFVQLDYFNPLEHSDSPTSKPGLFDFYGSYLRTDGNMGTFGGAGFYDAPASASDALDSIRIQTNTGTWTGDYLVYADAPVSVLLTEAAQITALNDLTDATLTSPASGEVLEYNGSAWINSTIEAGSASLSGLSDTTITAPASGAILSYNGSEWIDTSTPVEVQTSGYVRTLIASGTVTAGTSITTPSLQGQGYRKVELVLANLDFSAEQYMKMQAVNGSGTVISGVADYGFHNDGGTISGDGYGNGDTSAAFMAVTYDGPVGSFSMPSTPSNGKAFVSAQWINPEEHGADPTAAPALFTWDNQWLRTDSIFAFFNGGGFYDASIAGNEIDALKITSSTGNFTCTYQVYADVPVSVLLTEAAQITALDDLSDTTTTSPASGQVLQYDGSTWSNTSASTVVTSGYQWKLLENKSLSSEGNSVSFLGLEDHTAREIRIVGKGLALDNTDADWRLEVTMGGTDDVVDTGASSYMRTNFNIFAGSSSNLGDFADNSITINTNSAEAGGALEVMDFDMKVTGIDSANYSYVNLEGLAVHNNATSPLTVMVQGRHNVKEELGVIRIGFEDGADVWTGGSMELWGLVPTSALVTEAAQITALDDLSDTTTTSPASGDVLTWNGAGLWVNEAGDEPDASDTVKGIVELATLAEVDAGTDTVRAVTPAGLGTIQTDVDANTAKTTNEDTNLSYNTAATTGTVISSDGTNATLPAATKILAGLMTGADKIKLDDIEASASASLSGLSDTTLSSLTSGDAIRWNGSAWINQQDGTPAVPSVSDLDDTTITSVASGDVLTWNGAGLWVNEAGGGGSLSGLSDTTTTAPASGEILQYDGSTWANAAATTVTTSGYQWKLLESKSAATAGTSVSFTGLEDHSAREIRIVGQGLELDNRDADYKIEMLLGGTDDVVNTGAADYMRSNWNLFNTTNSNAGDFADDSIVINTTTSEAGGSLELMDFDCKITGIDAANHAFVNIEGLSVHNNSTAPNAFNVKARHNVLEELGVVQILHQDVTDVWTGGTFDLWGLVPISVLVTGAAAGPASGHVWRVLQQGNADGTALIQINDIEDDIADCLELELTLSNIDLVADGTIQLTFGDNTNTEKVGASDYGHSSTVTGYGSQYDSLDDSIRLWNDGSTLIDSTCAGQGSINIKITNPNNDTDPLCVIAEGGFLSHNTAQYRWFGCFGTMHLNKAADVGQFGAIFLRAARSYTMSTGTNFTDTNWVLKGLFPV